MATKVSGRKLDRRELMGTAALAAGLEVLSPRLIGARRNAAATAKSGTHTFGWRGEHFLLDGKPFQIRSGEMHYARIPRPYWRDRLKKLKAMGLNTVATYMFWNFH